MHPDLSALVAMMNDAIALFRKHAITHWASWLERDIEYIRKSDFYGVQHLLSAYGGMGSLNDIGLAEPDPDRPGFLRTHADDPQLQELLSGIYAAALKIQREEA